MARSIKILSLIMLLFMGWSCGDDDDDVPNPQPSLNAPTGVSASNITSNSFNVNWNAVSDADTYTLQVSTDNSFGSFVLNQSGVTATNSSVTGLDAETEYFIRVSASNSAVTSDFSSMVTVTTEAEDTEPTNPNTTEATINGSVFTPNISEGKTSSDGKTQFVFRDGSGTITLTTTADAAGSFSISADGDHTATYTINDSVFTASSGSIEITEYAMTASGAYAFEADYAFTNGRVMESVSVTGGSFAGITLAPATAIEAPSIEDATQITDTGFTANWSAVAEAVAYLVDVSADESFTNMILSGEAVLGTSLVITDLQSGTDYFVRVRASDGLTVSGNSAVATAATSGSLEPTGLAAPVAEAASNITGTGFTANWTAVEGATEYIIEVATDNAYTNFVLTDESTTTNYAVSGLSAGTLYYYRIKASDGIELSENSNSITVTTSTMDTPVGGGTGQYVIETVQTQNGESIINTFEYNSSCKIIRSISSGEQEGLNYTSTSDYTYDSQGRLILITTETIIDGNTTLSELAFNGFTSDGFPLQVEIEAGAAGTLVYDYTYDNEGKVVSVVENILGFQNTYTYNYTGNNVTSMDQVSFLGNATWTFTYTTEGDNFYRKYLEDGYTASSLFLPYFASEDLISGWEYTLQGNTNITSYDYEFNTDGNPLSYVTTTTVNGVAEPQLLTAFTYSSNCN